MPEYRAYLIGHDGLIVNRADMICEDDDAAKERAQLAASAGQTVELWQGTRLVATFPNSPGNHADGGSLAEILVGRSATR